MDRKLFFAFSMAVEGARRRRYTTNSFIFEMFLSLFALAGTGALIYWFVGKRDIFPAMFVYYVGFYLIATFLLIMIYHNMTLPGNMISIRHNTLINIARIVYAAAWVIYVLKSQRVKQTFVYPAG